MTQAFNPFVPPAAPAAVSSPAHVAVQPQRAIPQGLNDAGMYDGFSTPFFKHVEGDWDVKITGYTGARSPKLGIACHITFEVLKSSCPDSVAVGSTWRVAYKYDFERRAKADLDTYGSDARALGLFVQALYGQKQGPGFDVSAAESTLHKHDFTANAGHAHLTGSFGKPKVRAAATGGVEQATRYRNDLWTPYRAPGA